MKKTLFGILVVLTCCISFISCSDDDFDVNRGTHSDLPENVISGSFTGEYEVYSADGVTLENTYPATVNISPGKNKYTLLFESVSSESVMNGAEENPLNVAWANNDIKFWGPSSAGTKAGFLNSAALNGTYSDGVLTFRFSKTVREGRKTITKFYQFKGSK